MNERTKPDQNGHGCEPVHTDTHCHPSHPAPGQNDDDHHTGECTGEIRGGITLHCNNHCHQLRTRTMIVAISPTQWPLCSLPGSGAGWSG